MAMTPSSERGLTMVELLVSSAVMMTVLMVTTSVMVSSSTMFGQQGAAMNARETTGAGMDLMTRLIRQSSCPAASSVWAWCYSINPDPLNTNTFNRIQVQGDWNPRDGDTFDSYENVAFYVVDGTLFKQEPNEAAVPLGTGVQSIAFTYADQNGVAMTGAAAKARSNLIGSVTVTIVSDPGGGMPLVTNRSTISLRRIK